MVLSWSVAFNRSRLRGNLNESRIMPQGAGAFQQGVGVALATRARGVPSSAGVPACKHGLETFGHGSGSVRTPATAKGAGSWTLGRFGNRRSLNCPAHG